MPAVGWAANGAAAATGTKLPGAQTVGTAAGSAPHEQATPPEGTRTADENKPNALHVTQPLATGCARSWAHSPSQMHRAWRSLDAGGTRG